MQRVSIGFHISWSCPAWDLQSLQLLPESNIHKVPYSCIAYKQGFMYMFCSARDLQRLRVLTIWKPRINSLKFNKSWPTVLSRFLRPPLYSWHIILYLAFSHALSCTCAFLLLFASSLCCSFSALPWPWRFVILCLQALFDPCVQVREHRK